MEVLNVITQLLYNGFIEAVILLFILKIVFKKPALWNDLFLIANGILLINAVLYGFVLFRWIAQDLHASDTGEQSAFKWRILGPYWYSYWLAAALPFVAPQVFWLKRVRKSAIASLAMVPFLTAGGIISFLIIHFNTFRDARPSAWNYYNDPPRIAKYLIPLLVFGALLMMIYFIRRKIRKSARIKPAI